MLWHGSSNPNAIRTDGESTLLCQHFVNELDADRALADGGGNALDASGADVADGENTGPVRLEEKGRAAERPLRCLEVGR